MAARSRSGKNPNFRSGASAASSRPQRPGPFRVPTARRDAKKDTQRPNRCLRLLGAVGGTLVLLLLFALLAPSNIDPASVELPAPPAFTGALLPNVELRAADRMFEFLIRGPESIAVHEGNFYTGTLNGKIMRIDRQGRMKVFVALGKVNCSSFATCGRPLGLRIDPTGRYLLVADVYLGLFRVDLRTGVPQKLFPVDEAPNVTFLNDLDVLPSGEMVVSETSTKFPFHQMAHEILEMRPNGRLLLIDAKESQHRVLHDRLQFPNGVQADLSDPNAVLVAETTRFRISRVFVHGPRSGQAEVFAGNLPGMPDNIRATQRRDGYWVAMSMVRRERSWRDRLSTWPALRAAIVKILPAPLIFHFGRTRYGLVLRLDLHGRIVSSLHDPTGEVIRDVSEVTEHGGALYLGNYDGTFIGRLDQACLETNTCQFRADKKERNQVKDGTQKVKEPVKKEVKEPVKKEVKEPVKKEVKEPVKKEVKEPVKKEVKEPVKKEVNEPVKEVKVPVKEGKIPVKKVEEPVKKEVKEPVKEIKEPLTKEKVKVTAAEKKVKSEL